MNEYEDEYDHRDDEDETMWQHVYIEPDPEMREHVIVVLDTSARNPMCWNCERPVERIES